jgi:predicted type IV restriction endonuclease
MLVECKEPKTNLSEDVLQQVLRYNISVPVEYIVITNGTTTVGWKKENELRLLNEMPWWV